MELEIEQKRDSRGRIYDPIARRKEYEKSKSNPDFKRKSSGWGKKSRQKHKERVNETNRKWRNLNKEKVKEYRKRSYDKIKENSILKLHENIRGLIKGSFKRCNNKYTKISKTKDILGCTVEQFRIYILNKCPKGTTLKDFGRFGYHLDHIIPVCTANCEEDIIKLNHYTNFQPLWWSENLSKSGKIL